MQLRLEQAQFHDDQEELFREKEYLARDDIAALKKVGLYGNARHLIEDGCAVSRVQRVQVLE